MIYSYYTLAPARAHSRERKTGSTRCRYQQDLFGLKTADEAVPPQSCQCSALQCREHPARRQRPRLCRHRERSFSTARRATTWSSRRRSWRGGCITTTSRDALAGAASPGSGCGNICPRMRLPAVANPSLGAYLCSLARATAPSPSRLMSQQLDSERNFKPAQRPRAAPTQALHRLWRPLHPQARFPQTPTLPVVCHRDCDRDCPSPWCQCQWWARHPPGPVGEARCRARATGLADR
jgi:hypothetical protein